MTKKIRELLHAIPVTESFLDALSAVSETLSKSRQARARVFRHTFKLKSGKREVKFVGYAPTSLAQAFGILCMEVGSDNAIVYRAMLNLARDGYVTRGNSGQRVSKTDAPSVLPSRNTICGNANKCFRANKAKSRPAPLLPEFHATLQHYYDGAKAELTQEAQERKEAQEADTESTPAANASQNAS